MEYLLMLMFLILILINVVSATTITSTLKPTRYPTHQPAETTSCPANAIVVKDSTCAPDCYEEPYGNCKCQSCDRPCEQAEIRHCNDGYTCFAWETNGRFNDPSYPDCNNLVCNEVEKCDNSQPPYCWTESNCCEDGGKGVCHGDCYYSWTEACEPYYCEVYPIDTCSGMNYCYTDCYCDSTRSVCDYSSCCKCKPGYYSSNSGCTQCPAGSTTTAPGQAQCKCAPGYTSPTGYAPCSPLPSKSPSRKPSATLTVKPSPKLTAKTSPKLTAKPSLKTTLRPTPKSTFKPTTKSTLRPSAKLTSRPYPKSSARPSAKPTAKPSSKLTLKPSPKRTLRPVPKRTVTPVTSRPVLKSSVKPTPKPTYKPVNTDSCPKNSHVVNDKTCTPTCFEEPYGNCECTYCPSICTTIELTICKDNYECVNNPLIKDTTYPICKLDCKEVTYCNVKDCSTQTVCYHNGYICDTIKREICTYPPCQFANVDTCYNPLPFPRCDNRNCMASCDSTRTNCDYTSCCKCDPGFYTPTGSTECIPCRSGIC